MASQTTYMCDWCGSPIDQRDLDTAPFGVVIARANCAPYWDAHGDCCKRCRHIIVDAVLDATKRCKEVARG